MLTRERRQLRLFIRRDTYGRYVSCLVYLPARPLQHHGPRAVRRRSCATSSAASTSSSPPGSTSRRSPACTSWSARPRASIIPEVDVADLERRLAEASRSWRDDFAAAVRHRRTARSAAPGWPGATSTPSPRPTRRTSRPAPAPSTWAGSRPSRATRASTCRSTSRSTPAPGEARLKVYRIGSPLSLSQVLPMLSSMGVEVVDERPYELEGLAAAVVHLRLRAAPRPAVCPPTQSRAVPGRAARGVGRPQRDRRLQRAGARRRADLAPGHRAARLREVHAAGQHARSRSTTSRRRCAATSTSPGCWCSCSRPGSTRSRRPAARPTAEAASRQGRGGRASGSPRALDDVASLDHDRILRSYLTHITRHAAHQLLPARPTDGAVHAYMSFKLEPSAHPRPARAAARASRSSSTRPRVEGVHLRFGAVARGGLRWSDRRDDFRTEVLGLVKAQMVKNAVIVPVGAKGGFFCKQLPDSGRPRRVAGRGHRLLHDLHLRPARHHRQPRRRRDRAARATSSATTATTPTSWSPPTRAPRRSPTSPTASPRTTASGSATPSPPAARSATTTRRWASPPGAPGCRCSGTSASAGIDCQTEDFTAVGIGDMSGDVFGNGMLCSEHIRLVAAFDHRDIFLDPDPDAATSYAERQRLFDAAALELAGLRHVADLRGRRRLLPLARSRSRSTTPGPRGARPRRTTSPR